MALTIAIEGTGILSNAENITNWALSGSGGVSISLNTETFIQGSNSVASKISSGKYGWIYYDYGSAVGSLDFTDSSGANFGEYIYIWFNCTTLAFLNTKATPGLSIRLGTNASNYREWTLGGNDDLGNAYNGGWLCAVIDPNSAGTSDTGTYTISTVNFIGVYFNMSGSSVAQNCFVDTIACGKGLRITGTETTSQKGWDEVVEYCNDSPSTRVWGMMQRAGGIFNFYGKAYIGDSAQTADTDFSGINYVIKWGDFEYWNGSAWVSSISDNFHGLTIEDDETYETFFEDGIIVGSDSGRAGSIFIGADNANTTFDLYGGLITTSTTKLYGTTLLNITGGIIWGNDSDHICYGVKFSGCGQFDPVGGVVIRNCEFLTTVDSYSGSNPNGSALLWNNNINIQKCNFIANTDATYNPHAIQHDTAGTYGYTDLNFSGNDYDIHFTPSSGDLTINATDSNPSTYENLSSGTVTINISANVEITVVDSSGDPLVGARVFVEADSGGNYPSYESVTIVSSGTTATVTHTTHGMFNGQQVAIRGANEQYYNGVFTITYINVNSYSYTMSGDPASPATGTITATFVFMEEVTVALGIATESVKYNGDQDLQGYARYNPDPFYKQGNLSGTFTTDGFIATSQLGDD